jgi:DnaJ-domain-containing protein 1
LDIDGDRHEAPARACDFEGCAAEGLYRAPQSPGELTSYYWFCIEHVRGYNAKWDFFAGMSETEIEAFRRDDVTGHRPTWRLGTRERFGGVGAGGAWRDLFNVFGGSGQANTEPPAQPRLAGERDALAEMGLEHSATQADIKSRFKQLVKRHHPDANGGDKKGEERLKVVIKAYRMLVRRRSA